MKTTLNSKTIESDLIRLQMANAQFSQTYPGESGRRQPVSVLYGGAHLFKADTAQKLGAIAQRMLKYYLIDAQELARCFHLETTIAVTVFSRLTNKLTREPIEDLRIDFEDGYGYRADEEEDSHAIEAAKQTALAIGANALPPYFGIRIKSLNLESTNRALRSLDLYLTTLCETSDGKLPNNFVVTLPKVVHPEQVNTFAELCSKLESALGLSAQSLQIELMIETPQSIINERGVTPLPKLIAAAQGRCRGVHFGAFDYTAACGITASYQDIRHPICDFARSMMLTALSGSGVWLSDGVTTTLPMEVHRKESLTHAEVMQNSNAIHHAWRVHYENIRHSLRNGFYQSWDLHPAQLIPRYVATYAFFLEGLDAATERLRNFLNKAAKATTVGNVFDDAATGQGLLNYFVRAVHCGAIDQAEAQLLTGLTIDELRSASFVKIIQSQRNKTQNHRQD